MSRVMLLATVATVSFGVFVFGIPGRVAACSCASFADEEALENADAAFTGTLVETITPAGDADSSTDPKRFVFDVDEVFKGEVFARQSIADFAACALQIRGPGPFVVFAHTKTDGFPRGAADGELYSDMCSGTRVLASRALPASFGVASLPVPGTSAIGDSGTQRPILQIATIAGVLALLGAGCVFALHRRRQGAT